MMNKSLVIGLIAGIAVAATGAVVATRMVDRTPEFVDVVRAVPVTRTVEVPRQECTEQPVASTRQRDDDLTNGTIIGAVVGGVLGNQVGGGSGRKAATVVGAVAGGYAGREADRRHRTTEQVTGTQTVCRDVVDAREETIGYDVTYLLDGKRETLRMDRDPGDRIAYAEIAPTNSGSR